MMTIRDRKHCTEEVIQQVTERRYIQNKQLIPAHAMETHEAFTIHVEAKSPAVEEYDPARPGMDRGEPPTQHRRAH